MRNWKRIAFGAAAAALVLTFALPKAAHAVATMMVQVINTSTNPVPNQDVVRAARIPYESTQQPQGNCPSGSGVQNCVFVWPAPPAGYRLVVQNVSGWITLNGSATASPFAVLSDFDGGRNTFWSFTGTLGQPANTVIQSSFNQPTLAVFDEAPGMTVTANFQSNIGQFMTLSGYLENCAVAGCQIKAH